MSLRERKIRQRLFIDHAHILLGSCFGLDYPIKDAGFKLLIEVGVKGLDDLYTLKKKLQFNRSRFALRIIIKTNPNLASDKIKKII